MRRLRLVVIALAIVIIGGFAVLDAQIWLMNARIGQLVTKVNGIDASFGAKFEETNAKLDAANAELDAISQRLSAEFKTIGAEIAAETSAVAKSIASLRGLAPSPPTSLLPEPAPGPKPRRRKPSRDLLTASYGFRSHRSCRAREAAERFDGAVRFTGGATRHGPISMARRSPHPVRRRPLDSKLTTIDWPLRIFVSGLLPKSALISGCIRQLMLVCRAQCIARILKLRAGSSPPHAPPASSRPQKVEFASARAGGTGLTNPLKAFT